MPKNDIKTQGKAALALKTIKAKWKRYGIPEFDDPEHPDRNNKVVLEQIRKDWDSSLNPYSEKTIKQAIANYALFDKFKDVPPSLEDLEARLNQFFARDEELPTDPDSVYRQHAYEEERKKRLTTLRRWSVSIWRNHALNEFYYNGLIWEPAWDNFLETVAKVDRIILNYYRKQITQWDGSSVPEMQKLVQTLRQEYNQIAEIIRTEKVH